MIFIYITFAYSIIYVQFLCKKSLYFIYSLYLYLYFDFIYFMSLLSYPRLYFFLFNLFKFLIFNLSLSAFLHFTFFFCSCVYKYYFYKTHLKTLNLVLYNILKIICCQHCYKCMMICFFNLKKKL